MYIGNNLVIGHTTRRGILNTDHDGNVVSTNSYNYRRP